MATTQIAGRQIQNGAIDDSKVAAGANIASSKLADGSNFVKKDGSVAFTGSPNAGNNPVINVSTPSNGTDAANKSYVDTAIANLNSFFSNKPAARVASTANVTVSNPGTSSFDGVTLSVNDRILLKNQSTQAENGLYVFNGSSSALTRVTDMDSWAEVPGAFVVVEEGATNADTVWLCTSNQGGTLGTTAITWQQIPTSAGLTNTNFVDEETPSGTINGSNTTFTLANTPVSGSVHLHLNGQRIRAGAGNDYTISSATITMLTAPVSGDVLTADYRK